VRGGNNENVADAARAVADRLNLTEEWLNFDVTRVDALPTLGREVEWHTIYTSPDDGGVIILGLGEKTFHCVIQPAFV